MSDFSIKVKNNSDFWDKINSSVIENKKCTFNYLNTYTFYLSNKSEKYFNALTSSSYLRAGGYSIILANKIKRNFSKEIEKVAFNHFFINYNGQELLSKSNYKVFLLGSSDNNLQLIIDKNKISNRFINIIGSNNGFFSNLENLEVINKINLASPDILLVGLGTPKSDLWILQNFDKLKNMVIITVGNFFDIWAGDTKIAPKILFNSPFEWIHRLFQEPKKLTRRYINANIYFLIKLVNKL